KVAYAAWSCPAPGAPYDTTSNEWHTCTPEGRINAWNPCVTGDTSAATGGVLLRIDPLRHRDYAAIRSPGQLHDVGHSFQPALNPVYRMRSRAGYEVKLTADHKVLTANRGDVPAHELTKDDLAVLGRGLFADRRKDTLPGGFVHLDDRLTEL